MTRARLATASLSLIAAGAQICFLRTTVLRGAQPQSNTPLSPSAPLSNTTQPTWHSKPASTPPDTEIVPPPPPIPPPGSSLILGPQQKGGQIAANRRAGPLADSLVGGKRWSPSAAKFATVTNADLSGDSNAPDPETQRIRDELERLRDDTGARRAFYDELRRTVQRVRAGLPEEDPPDAGPASPSPVSEPTYNPPSHPSNPPAAIQPGGPTTPEPERRGPRAAMDTRGGTIDRAAYKRVVRWAKANGAPVPLALGVAWMESHLHTYPPRGAAGEVGMFQIMPARCRLEGWPARRLNDPEFNAWLGTLLLARYYQQEGSWARAAAQYVAGPKVFERRYSNVAWTYINWYASSVNSYAGYFSRYQS